MIAWLRRGAEAVLVLMMAAMFVAFILQVVFRYVMNLPVGWTDEVCTLVWLWGILWGASFVLRNREDIRFDMLYNLLPRRVKRVATLASSSILVLLLAASLPKTWSYISFMQVEKSAAMGIPLNAVFGLYLVFLLSMCVRHAGIARDAWLDRLTEDEFNLADQDPLQSKEAA